MNAPLIGLKVLDLSRVLAGPFAGRMLSDLGADVVKVEPPEGDVTRFWGRRIAGQSGYYVQQNAGKRAICLDLKSDTGVELAVSLAGVADVVLENFRPGVLDRLGLGYPTLAAANPRLVLLSISGFGADGPESGRAAYAPIIHAETGLVDGQVQRAERTTGQRPPAVDLVASFADTNAALHGLVAVLAALHMRERTGCGQHIDLAMVDATLVTDDRLHYTLDDAADSEPLNAEVWETAAGPLMISADFRYVWKRLVATAGISDPTPAGASLEEKIACRRDAVWRLFNETLDTREAVLRVLDAANLAWGDVRTRSGSLTLPTVQARRSIVQIDDRAGGTRPVPQSPYRMSAADTGVRGGAPHLGEHNAEVLEDWLGLDEGGRRRYADVLLREARQV